MLPVGVGPMQKSPLGSAQEKRTKSMGAFGFIAYAENT
jgi:hypothetical protein